MRNSIVTLVILALFYSQTALAHTKSYPVHLLPDQRAEISSFELNLSDSPQSSFVNEAIRVGEKNMAWLKHMNSIRPDDQKIALTKKGELTPIPIDKPKVYSPETIEKDFRDLSTNVPEVMNKIIFGSAGFTDDPGLELEIYILWAKKVDKMYQTATRWTLMTPYLTWYKQNKKNDIRGYYFLAKEENLSEKLQGFAGLSQEDQSRLTPLLVNLCENTKGSTETCQKEFQKAATNNTLLAFFQSYNAKSKKLFDANFLIEGVRKDIKWSSTLPNRAFIPIRDTQNDEVNRFLEFNNEDEWKWGDWQLDLYFTPDAAVHVEFVPGETPHVNGIGGNTITMDGNAPLTEWDVQWTIRHEFGHVLGFPDCYIEFYDSNLKAMVNYQIDTTNLMCSRAGKLQELHYTEMKKAYFN